MGAQRLVKQHPGYNGHLERQPSGGERLGERGVSRAGDRSAPFLAEHVQPCAPTTRQSPAKRGWMHREERVGVSKAPWLATDLVVCCAPLGTHGVSPALLVPISSGSSWPWLITLLGFARPTPAWPWGNGEHQRSAGRASVCFSSSSY